MWNKITAVIMVASIISPVQALSESPSGAFQRVPPGEAHKFNTHAWCYDDEANAVLLLAAEREREACRLKVDYAKKYERAKSDLIIDNLNLRISTLTTEYEQITKIKDEEIERLTEIATSLPNDHSVWWASGGFAVGILVTIIITSVVK